MMFFKKIIIISIFFLLSFFPIVKIFADTTTYNFSGVNTGNDGINENPIVIEHDSDIFPWTTLAEQNDSANPTDVEYVNISTDNTSQWATDDPGRKDEMAITYKFFIQETISDISNIQIKWNGNTDGTSSSNHSVWLRKDGLDEFGGINTWVQLGTSLSIPQDIDTDLIRNLTTDFATYINASTGQFEFVITTDRESEDMRTNYIEIITTYTVIPPADTTPPSAILDLSSSNATTNSIDLSWTAVGDDNLTGLASSYDIRYAISPITESNWSSATQVSGEPSPSIGGSSELMTVSGLNSNTTYYFAIKTSDEVPNESIISNVPSETTNTIPPIPDTTPPSDISDLASFGATTSSIELNWTAVGDDNLTGLASSYDIRYAISPITESNWSSATQVSGEPSPSIGGSSELMTVSGLNPDTLYHFAIKSSDEVPNESEISNATSLSTDDTPLVSDTTPPSDISDLSPSNATTNSIDLSWTAVGDDNLTGLASSYDVRYSTTAVTESSWSSATLAIGEPNPSSPGSSESFSITNIPSETTYYFAIKTSDESNNQSTISNIPSLSTLAESSVSIPTNVSGGVSATSVIFSGLAYPNSKIIVRFKDSVNPLYNNVPLSTYSISSSGEFYVSYAALLSGAYFFTLQAQDKDNQKTDVLSFNVDFRTDKKLMVEDIFFSPTISFNQDLLRLSDALEIHGYSSPNSKIKLEIDDIILNETISDKIGYYSFEFSPGDFTLGVHYARVSQNKDDRESNYTSPRSFKVTSLTYPRADFNRDNSVDVTDWSVFLYRWGDMENNLRNEIDLDSNGIIDIGDFSIFLKAIKL
ncbi:MAG: hypothetical protein KAJ58_02410 [Candidatus Pacebacteria bacterium]|nr:hypothetical protein [Candidatus Paceibacterota bacterium]